MNETNVERVKDFNAIDISLRLFDTSIGSSILYSTQRLTSIIELSRQRI